MAVDNLAKSTFPGIFFLKYIIENLDKTKQDRAFFVAKAVTHGKLCLVLSYQKFNKKKPFQFAELKRSSPRWKRVFKNLNKKHSFIHSLCHWLSVFFSFVCCACVCVVRNVTRTFPLRIHIWRRIMFSNDCDKIFVVVLF